MIALIRDAIACIEHGGEVRCSGVDGAAALEMSLAAFVSTARGGAEVQLPLADRATRVLSR